MLVPDILREGRRSTLENYVAGTDLEVETYPTADGNADLEALEEIVDEETVMIYAENPTIRGTIEENLSAIGESAADARHCSSSGPIRLRCPSCSVPRMSVRTS